MSKPTPYFFCTRKISNMLINYEDKVVIYSKLTIEFGYQDYHKSKSTYTHETFKSMKVTKYFKPNITVLGLFTNTLSIIIKRKSMKIH